MLPLPSMSPLCQPVETVKLSSAMQRLQGKCLLPYKIISAIFSLAHCGGSRLGILVFGRPIKHDLVPLSTNVFFLLCRIRLYTLLFKFQQSKFVIFCIISIWIDTNKYIYLYKYFFKEKFLKSSCWEKKPTHSPEIGNFLNWWSLLKKNHIKTCKLWWLHWLYIKPCAIFNCIFSINV